MYWHPIIWSLQSDFECNYKKAWKYKVLCCYAANALENMFVWIMEEHCASFLWPSPFQGIHFILYCTHFSSLLCGLENVQIRCLANSKFLEFFIFYFCKRHLKYINMLYNSITTISWAFELGYILCQISLGFNLSICSPFQGFPLEDMKKGYIKWPWRASEYSPLF